MISIVKTESIMKTTTKQERNLLNWCIFPFLTASDSASKIANDVDLLKSLSFFLFRMALSIIFFNSSNSLSDRWFLS
jgi:hypothetical protein